MKIKKADIVYISGGITSVNNHKEIFERCERELIKQYQCRIINPTRHNQSIGDWSYYMDIAQIDVRKADVIMFLPNWEQSKGATIEMQWAKEQNKKILFYKESGK